MAYEYEKENISKVNHFNIVTGSNNVSEPSEELKEVYRKAKAFDKVRSFITKRLKEEETTDEYDYGERFMCEEIKRLWEDE
ncbi:hypothetical protein BUZ00_03105 [Staphylococcus gallinarum]|uniref:hypothetical protein n=1 Tax=Staphylococcus gallinarum TaxID=1293 RepID=UPI000D1C9AD1|nr:hypothetical protein [Staphylococcus gallinarum]PTE37226.1 hypothetical protein BUZ00_03105 [Staphylococcus gallinarum]